ncbi:uncharacterized protein STEHIDRAFT_149438 [Stereum hirsutum FP-91666 SS1]|uniref:uncharacterized protein n=1 Tax=Stereum hirsutum (strain FP-91666) TaxID=721885 RepID=UPI00044491F7|nr:uncharacterized protein STEHIDRAFT_149438 [Stereum hirsutum FP-91666 SS1]EIM82281.1 hypothetical protein STEHIDRAFT_149438 [Stereum hirsutum FP-91666 SS1]
MSMSSAVSLMPRHNISMIRPSRTISMPVRQTPKRVPLPLLTVPSQAPLTSTSTSTSSSSSAATYSSYASGYGGARSGRRTAPVMSYASAASPSSSASASPPGRTSITSTSTAPSQLLSPSTTLAQEQREARAKAVAVLLLNRAGLSGRRRRTYFGPRQYVRSGLSSCVVVAEEGADGEGGVELVGGEMEKVGVVEGSDPPPP